MARRLPQRWSVPKTIGDYQAVVYKFQWWWSKYYAADFGMHPKNITTKHARAFAAYLREPVAFRWGEKVVRDTQQLSPVTVASYGRSVKVFFNWLEQESYIEESPFNKSVKFTQRHKQDRVVKIVEKDDLNLLFHALTQPDYLDTYHGCRNLAIISLLLDSGMRRGELLNLIVNGKTGERWAFFNPVCNDALTRYLEKWRYPQEEARSAIPARQSTSPLWMTEDFHPLSYESISKITRQLERRSGVKFHLHSLRHTYATHMITRTDVYTVQRLLGHKSIRTTEQYLWTNRESLEANYRPHSPLDALAGEQSGLKRRRGRPRKQ
jgi:site-specific recombinase XerD